MVKYGKFYGFYMAAVLFDIDSGHEVCEELAWPVDKRLWVISTIRVLRSYRELAVLNLKQYCIHCYVALSYVF